jgi:hypothetical protein
MKFLCRNCKAKYQIADEKVAGRTLRMTCQQCGEPIVVRGASRNQPASRPIAPNALGMPAQASALGAGFQRQLSEPARELNVTQHEEWHVAINDVPVGPMRREEVARKVAIGAIARESLAWREGMDDWLPIKHIAELSVMFGPTPGMGASLTSPPSASGLTPVAPGPATRGDMAPIGSRQMVAIEEYVPTTESEMPEMTVATVGALPAEASPPGRQLGWAPMFALVSGGAFILAAGALLGVRVLAPTPAATPGATAAIAQTANAGPARPASGETASPQNTVIELDMQAIDGTSNSAARRAGAAAAAATPVPTAIDKKGGKALTDEQKEMLARMGGGLNHAPSNIRAPADNAPGANQGAGQLTAAQLSAVVLNGRKNLQRCYETALRGANSNETVRLDVDIQVSPSGNVTSVHTSGKGLPGMDDCLTRTVRMWRFPMSGETTQTRFPVVFQPGA